MEKLIVVPLKLDPSFHQDIIGKLSSRAFDWCNNNVGVPLKNYILLISKVENVACSYRF